MPLKSPIEDLRSTTLQAISGLLARLEYVSHLRKNGGNYKHWGFERLHGEEAAQDAMKQAHRAALSRVLRTPLQRMAQDTVRASEQTGLEASQYVSGLSTQVSELLPENPSAGSERHLSAVLHALVCLLKNG